MKEFNKNKGMVISFEGITGSGKTTLIKCLRKSLENEGYVIYVKPDFYTYQDNSVDGAIKKMLSKDMQFLKIGYPIVEALLIAAKRAYDSEKYLRPALNEGKIVLLDRGVDTYYAYHTVSILEHFPAMEIKQVIDWLNVVDKMGGIIPDLTIYLSLDLDTAFKRSKKNFNLNQRIREYYKKIIEIYEYLAEIHNKRIVKIDARKSIDEIHKEVLTIILKRVGDYYE